MISYRNEAKS
jgi:hypothetical protein